ncbi:MAG: tRNA (adenosine(37)-N6)-dimethylallyltransferase MiaA [Flavobacteriaceae bacterium]|nr:tRNA (adenosine(37)-N6)-dimethylallyltransferase MiaA [Flavobacteriaceae bacterium]
MNTTNYLLTIVGPTAIGKTALSIALAQALDTEVFSADSRQFFREMTIGTAVPEEEELAVAKHHFIQHISIHQNYSVGDFERECIHALDRYFEQKNIGVLVGGSGMYVDAVIHGLDIFPKVDPTIRIQLNQELETEGIKPLQQKLVAMDPVYAAKVDIHNPQRIIRALEICIGSGKAYSSFLRKVNTKRNFKPLYIGLEAPRDILYDRINKRVDLMMDKGLLNEVQNLYPYRHLNALNTVGYKELFRYLDGEWELEFAVSEIKKNTRRFAKRQLTWYRKNPNIFWIDFQTDLQQSINNIQKLIS